MNYRRKIREEKSPFFMKEVIFPEEKKKFETNLSYLEISSKTLANHSANEWLELQESTLYSSAQIGEHKVQSIGELLILEKKPLENYFTGTKGKKQFKKKIKPQKVTQSFEELCCKESQTESNEKIPCTSRKKDSLAKEEKTQKKKLQVKIQTFEKMQEHKYLNNYMRQRLAEEKYVQQQENLAETWLEFIKRRRELKEINSGHILPHQKPLYRDYCNNSNKINISIISRKFWDVPPRKKFNKVEKQKEKESRPLSDNSKLHELGKEFIEKLVFVDDENKDSDESDHVYSHGCLQSDNIF